MRGNARGSTAERAQNSQSSSGQVTPGLSVLYLQPKIKPTRPLARRLHACPRFFLHQSVLLASFRPYPAAIRNATLHPDARQRLQRTAAAHFAAFAPVAIALRPTSLQLPDLALPLRYSFFLLARICAESLNHGAFSSSRALSGCGSKRSQSSHRRTRRWRHI